MCLAGRRLFVKTNCATKDVFNSDTPSNLEFIFIFNFINSYHTRLKFNITIFIYLLKTVLFLILFVN
jgi:hypothetical protein